jgi:hypothetical protein
VICPQPAGQWFCERSQGNNAYKLMVFVFINIVG